MQKPALAVGLGFLLSSACAQERTAPMEVATLEPPTVSGAVKLTDENLFLNAEFIFENPCTGEEILFAGTDHIIIKVWDNGKFYIHNQFNLNGTGVSSGLKYRYTDAVKLSGGPGELPATRSVVAKVISVTQADNWLLKDQIHVTENGDVTKERVAERCLG